MKRSIVLFLSATLFLMACGQGKQDANEQQEKQGTPVSKGKQLFIDNCQQCHSLKQDKNGPKLEGVLARWDNDTSHVINFIKNSQQVINGGNTYAVRLYSTWGNAMMPPFSTLSDADVKEILNYINKGVE